MAMPVIPNPPTVPSREQDPATFNTNVPTFLSFMANHATALQAWNAQLETELNAAVQAAYDQYDPAGHYTADQVDALIAAQEARIESDSYFFNVTAI